MSDKNRRSRGNSFEKKSRCDSFCPVRQPAEVNHNNFLSAASLLCQEGTTFEQRFWAANLMRAHLREKSIQSCRIKYNELMSGIVSGELDRKLVLGGIVVEASSVRSYFLLNPVICEPEEIDEEYMVPPKEFEHGGLFEDLPPDFVEKYDGHLVIPDYTMPIKEVLTFRIKEGQHWIHDCLFRPEPIYVSVLSNNNKKH